MGIVKPVNTERTLVTNPPSRKNSAKILLSRAGFAGAFLFFHIWRTYLPERSMETAGWRAFPDLLFTLLFFLSIVILSGGIGYFILSRIAPGRLSSNELSLFSVPVGITGIGMAVFGMGWAGWINHDASLALLLGLAFLAADAGGQWISTCRDASIRCWAILRSRRRGEQLLLWMLIGFGFLGILRVVSPPWDADGLIYHLQVPKLFIQMGRIAFLPDNGPANYPLLPDMISLLGLLWSTDTLPRIMHLLFFYLFTGSLFLFARKQFGSQIGWLSLAALLSVPALPYWSTLAYIDLIWATMQFLMVYAFFEWIDTKDSRWLLIGGIFAGAACGSKYYAAGAFLIVLLWAVGRNIRSGRMIIRPIAGCILIAGIIAGPWYLKNLISSGNPIYPLAFGPQANLPLEQQYWQDYMQLGFGTGRGWSDYLTLPINLYAQYNRFTTLNGGWVIDLPGMLFPLGILAILASNRRKLSDIAVLLAGWFVLWAAGSQQNRFLLPIFPLLAVLTGIGMAAVQKRGWSPRILRLGKLLVGFVLLTSVFLQCLDVVLTRPWGPAFGLESKSDFLTRTISDFGAEQFVQKEMAEGSGVFKPWNARGYYCGSRCFPDLSTARWAVLAEGNPDPSALTEELSNQGITHLLIVAYSVEFQLQHDHLGKNLAAWDYLVQRLLPACGRQIYGNSRAQIIALECDIP